MSGKGNITAGGPPTTLAPGAPSSAPSTTTLPNVILGAGRRATRALLDIWRGQSPALSRLATRARSSPHAGGPDQPVALRRPIDATHPTGAEGLRWGTVKASALILSLIFSAGLLSREIGSPDPSWVRWLTLLPLLAALRFMPPAKAFACGTLWGCSLLLFMLSFDNALVSANIRSFGLLSIIPGAYAFLGARITRRFGFNPLILGFAWAGVELALIPLHLEGGLLVSIEGHEPGSLLGAAEGLFGYVCMAAFIVAANGILLAIVRRACVRVSGSLRRYVNGPIKGERRFFPLEVPHCPSLCGNPAQPRAPPA